MSARNGAGPASGTTDGEARKVFATGERRALSKPNHPKTHPISGERPIASIRFGERHRRDLGNVDSLATSIADLGLMHPVVITPDGDLIAGARRLEACKRIGWTDIPVTVVNLDAIVRGEFAENTERKDFTLSEAVAVKRALEPAERAAAKERQREHGKTAPGKKHSGEIPHSDRRALDKIARVVGKDRTTIAKAEAIVDAAEAEPEKFGKLLAAMDKTGRANGPYKRLKNAQQAEQIRAEPPPLPNRGPYRVGNVDVPWPYEPDDQNPSHRGILPYPTMSIAEMCSLPVGQIMHEDSILWFWTTNFHLRNAYTVLDAWGFHETPTMLTWAKDRMGNGHWLRGQTEHAILAVRGKPIITLTNQTTLLHAPVRAHSQKPVEFYDFVEKLCPSPRYADIFSRYQHSTKWDCHGDEAPGAGTLNTTRCTTEAAE
jgi:N6-adenosine-specific RNA methylase IME4